MALRYTIKDGKLYEIVDGVPVLKGTPDKNILNYLKEEFHKSREERGIVGNDNPVTIIQPVVQELKVKKKTTKKKKSGE